MTALVLILVAGGFPFYLDFDDRTENVVRTLSTERLNRVDQDQMEAGYYEGLLDMGGYTSALARIQGRTPHDWINLRDTEFVKELTDVQDFELQPSMEGEVKGAQFQTNEWGMRDQHYTLERQPDVHRTALIGASYNMGSGVSNPEVFEALVEQKLNETPPDATDYRGFEMLNFSVGGYSLLHQVPLIESKVARFAPDVALVTVHTTEPMRMRLHLQSLVNGDKYIPYPEVQRMIDASGAHPLMQREELSAALDPVALELEEWSLRQIATRLSAAGIKPVAVYVPSTLEYEGTHLDRRDRLKTLCEQAGFTFLEIDNPFITDDIRALQIADWDTHPNAEGHRLLAENLYQLIVREADTFMMRQAGSRGAE